MNKVGWELLESFMITQWQAGRKGQVRNLLDVIYELPHCAFRILFQFPNDSYQFMIRNLIKIKIIK